MWPADRADSPAYWSRGSKIFTQITGVDVDEEMIERARQNIDQENVDFKVMDAANLEYPRRQLRHGELRLFAPPPAGTGADAIAEIKRVLKPGGVAVFVEMYRDHLTETQKTESELHHWAGRIDTARGICHRQTYLRQEILEMIDPEEWKSARVYDLADLSFDPKGEEITNLILGTIDRVVVRARDCPTRLNLSSRPKNYASAPVRSGRISLPGWWRCFRTDLRQPAPGLGWGSETHKLDVVKLGGA